MLEELLIRDVGVIEEVTLRFASGLNVLTGETGTGKTMIVSALELLLGARADADQVRSGSSSALVEGRLQPAPSGAQDWTGDDDELIASREVTRDEQGAGRSRARISGRLAPAAALTRVVGSVVDVHGQADSAKLSSPARQRELLDRFGGPPVEQAAAAYAEVYTRWRDAQRELDELVEGQRDRAREADRLAFELAEIDAVAPQTGEEDTLDADLRRLQHAERLVAAAATAAAAIGDDGGARDALGTAVVALRDVDGVDERLDALHRRVESLAYEAQDVVLELGGYVEGLELDPAALARLRERRAAIGALLRKYGPDTAAVLAYGGEARGRLALLQGGDERADRLREEVVGLDVAVAEAARRLRAARRESGERLTAAVAGHLRDLAMAAATLEVALQPVEPGPHGADRVTFLLAPNAGEPALPLGKAASGGERSRVALAVRLALADADATPVLVFDEVDAGVGGATALAVGEKLARLARGRQVLCVTHLAQLAAHADAHFVVHKALTRGRTTATVRRLDDDERVTELSRMLSGTDSEAAAGHARELRAAAVAALRDEPG